MGADRLQEMVVLAAALACGVVLALVNPDHLPERLKSWVLALGKYRGPVGVVIILVVTALAIFG